jgi:hypothetical protein
MAKNNEYFKFSDGWFTYYVNKATGEKKFQLDDGDVEVDYDQDDFHYTKVRKYS